MCLAGISLKPETKNLTNHILMLLVEKCAAKSQLPLVCRQKIHKAESLVLTFEAE
jgi:hypothetical protein